MLQISNLPTEDTFTKDLTMESRLGGRLVYLVANQSVVARFRPIVEIGGSDTAEYGAELLLTPQSGVIDRISAVQFRSAVAGTPGRIVAQLTEPGDILPAAGTPFTSALAGSGQVSVATPQQFAAEATAVLVCANGVFQDVPGCSINFSVLGDNASALAIATFDMESSAVVAGVLILGQFNLDGTIVGVAAVTDFNGAAPVRATVGCQHLFKPLAKGAHTLKLVAEKTAAGGTYNIDSQTTLSLTLLDQ